MTDQMGRTILILKVAKPLWLRRDVDRGEQSRHSNRIGLPHLESGGNEAAVVWVRVSSFKCVTVP